MQSQNSGIAKSTAVLTVLVIILAVVAGVGWGQNAIFGAQSPTNTTTQAQYQNIVQLAKSEGTISIYGQVDTGAFDQYIASAFKAAYPWATVNYLGGTSGDNLNKELSEYKAHSVHSDIIEQIETNMVTLQQAGAIQAWYNPEEAMMGYPSSLLDPNNITHPFDLNSYVLIYNTNLVKNTSQLPNSWTDLANPIWKGKLAIDSPSRLSATGGVFALIGKNMSQSQWTSFLQAVAANQPLIASSSGGVYDDVSSGQAAIGIGATTDVVASLSKGAPVGYKWINPVPILQTPIAISTDAPDPYMAELFTMWITSWAGQAAIGASSRPPAFPPTGDATFYSQLPIHMPSSYVEVDFSPVLSTNATYYSNTYKNVFGK